MTHISLDIPYAVHEDLVIEYLGSGIGSLEPRFTATYFCGEKLPRAAVVRYGPPRPSWARPGTSTDTSKYAQARAALAAVPEDVLLALQADHKEWDRRLDAVTTTHCRPLAMAALESFRERADAFFEAESDRLKTEFGAQLETPSLEDTTVSVTCPETRRSRTYGYEEQP